MGYIMKKNYDFTLELAVRDYECDIDGVVNNAVYQNYMEHARNIHLKTSGLNYVEMTREKRHLYVARINIEYRYPLRCDDKFIVGTSIEKISGVSLDICQDIYRLPDQKLILNGKVVIVGVDESGGYRLPKEIIDTFGNQQQS